MPPAKATFTMNASAKIGKVNFPYSPRLDFARVPKGADIHEVATAVATRSLLDNIRLAVLGNLIKTDRPRELEQAWRAWRKDNPEHEVTDPYDLVKYEEEPAASEAINLDADDLVLLAVIMRWSLTEDAERRLIDAAAHGLEHELGPLPASDYCSPPRPFTFDDLLTIVLGPKGHPEQVEVFDRLSQDKAGAAFTRFGNLGIIKPVHVPVQDGRPPLEMIPAWTYEHPVVEADALVSPVADAPV